jgi:hypothetical protein
MFTLRGQSLIRVKYSDRIKAQNQGLDLRSNIESRFRFRYLIKGPGFRIKNARRDSGSKSGLKFRLEKELTSD